MAHTHHPITRRRHIRIRHFTVRLRYFSAAGSEATISETTIITVIMTAISTVSVIGRRNVSGTIATPVITRAKGANAG